MRAVLGAVAAVCVLAVVAIGCSDSGTDTTQTNAPAAAPESFFGVVPQTLINDDDLDRMAQGKVGTIRFVIPWSALDATPKQDDLDFSSIDPLVLGAAQRGIHVLPMIYGTPAWVAKGIDHDECDTDCVVFAPRSPEALAAWKDFIGVLVDRYGPDGELWKLHPDVDQVPIRTWQIWNEQNSPTFYRPTVDPAGYATMLEAASEAITDRDPQAEVVLGGMFGTPLKGKPPAIKAWTFLRELYGIDGARDSFDGVAVHPYAAHVGKIESQVSRMHDEIANADDDASMWITEVGASSETGGNPLNRGPEGQADQLREAFDFFLAKRQEWNIQAVTWYSWRDTPAEASVCDWCAGSGLFPADSLDPKPAWEAFVSFTGGS
jgi:hypothetical protein